MFEYVAACGTSYTHTAIGRRDRQPWSQVSHMHFPENASQAQETIMAHKVHIYPKEWSGCHVYEMAGRRWLREEMQPK